MASGLVRAILWDSGYLNVYMVKGEGREAADRIYCELLLPYGIDDGAVLDSRFKSYRQPSDCPESN